LHPDQQALTPAQEAEAWRFVKAYMQRQFSINPVDEEQAEAFLRQAYQVAGLPPPANVHWVNGPRGVLEVVAPGSGDAGQVDEWPSNVHDEVGWELSKTPDTDLYLSLQDSLWEIVKRVSLEEGIYNWEKRRGFEGDEDPQEVWLDVWDGVEEQVRTTLLESVIAYMEAPYLAYDLFLDVYLAPHVRHALACFNQMVSAYWLGTEAAVIVRRPRLLVRDERGRLHSDSGRCLEYHDGWGFSAWHGVVVPEHVILKPEALTREDWSREQNVEVRRVIQERMGDRFVPELGGVVLDSSPRGTLYEVRLPADDPEGVARYVQVQDASTARQYFVRVPPTILTAAEAVAWSFGLSVEAYGPAHET
jgi:hypothetical protein